MDSRDYTTGELAVLLNSILTTVKEIKGDMLTKSEFNTWREGLNERLVRLEQDHKELARESAEQHVQLEADSKMRHAEALKQIEELELRTNARFGRDVDAWKSTQETRQFQIEENVKGQVSSRFLTWTTAIASALLSFTGSAILLYINTHQGH